ncbi:hypothetical protein chiPu_0024062, partial [Chiloscyllium punctatum]|nr:hypothetical protein [Chiloscyllium punctatum]
MSQEIRHLGGSSCFPLLSFLSQGFRYFQPWLRGREELLLTVVNEDSSWRSASFPGSLVSSPDEGFGVAELPYAEQSLLTSLRSQK